MENMGASHQFVLQIKIYHWRVIMKKKRIWEPKSDKRKTKNISIRTTTEIANQIDEKAAKAGLSRNEFICKACQQNQIIVVPEGTAILQAIQETRNTMRVLPHTPAINEINVLLSKIIQRLRNTINQ